MVKARRTGVPEVTASLEGARPSRATMDVDPTWLEPEGAAQRTSRSSIAGRTSRTSGAARPSLDRPTMDVQPEWLESPLKPPPLPAPKRVIQTAKRKQPPPLPSEPDEDSTPGRDGPTECAASYVVSENSRPPL